jgi:hypothetical protein
MRKAKVRKDSFWGDFVNALLLSRPHREPTQMPSEETNSGENKKSDTDS